MNDSVLSDAVTKRINNVSSKSESQSTLSKFNEWRQRHSFLSLILEVIVLVVFVVIPFRSLVAQPFQVYGDSMLPNFHDNDYLIVNQLGTKFGNGPDRFEVVVFKFPGNNEDYYIKRIIGLPSETVQVENGTVTITSAENPEGITVASDFVSGTTFGNTEITLTEGEYFVMGDNRENSSDSRSWGALPAENIVGTPIIRLYPFNEIGLNPGSVAP